MKIYIKIHFVVLLFALYIFQIFSEKTIHITQNSYTHLVFTITLRAKYHLHLLYEQMNFKKVEWPDKGYTFSIWQSQDPISETREKRLFLHSLYQRFLDPTHSKLQTRATGYSQLSLCHHNALPVNLKNQMLQWASKYIILFSRVFVWGFDFGHLSWYIS